MEIDLKSPRHHHFNMVNKMVRNLGLGLVVGIILSYLFFNDILEITNMDIYNPYFYLNSLNKECSQIREMCISEKTNDITGISWNNNQNCDEWTFKNPEFKILTKNDALKILTNTTLIFLGNSVERRLGYTFSYLLYNEASDILTFNTTKIPDNSGLIILNGTLGYQEFLSHSNGIDIYSWKCIGLNITYNYLISSKILEIIKRDLIKNKNVILYIAITVHDMDFQFPYNFSLNIDGYNCDKEIHHYRYPPVNKMVFNKCWELNLKNKSLIFNPEIDYLYGKIINAINRYYNIDNPNFKIVFRSYMPKYLEYGVFHPYTSNVQNYYFSNNYLYNYLCDKLKIKNNKWKFIDMFELLMNKTNHDRYPCFPATAGGVHLKDYGRIVYAQTFLNTISRFHECR